MGKVKPILIFIIIFIMLAIIAVVAVNRSLVQKIEEKKETTDVNEKVVEGEAALPDNKKDMSLEDTIYAFAEIIYTYDTRERLFYEGADQYMTDTGYKGIVPLGDESEESTVVNMSSKLNKIKCYYSTSDAKNTEILAEVWYSISGAGDFQIQQIIKITAIYKDEWTINQCTVLSTVEK